MRPSCGDPLVTCEPKLVDSYRSNSLIDRGSSRNLKGRFKLVWAPRMNRPRKMSRRSEATHCFCQAPGLMRFRGTAATAAVGWTCLRVLTRASAISISASLAPCGPLLAATLVYCGSRSKSNRDHSKCYRNQCCSKIFHVPSIYA
jgi:hypothetical protein